VVGVALWLINNFIPMASSIKTILNIVVVVAVAIWVLQAVGLWGRVTSYRFTPMSRRVGPILVFGIVLRDSAMGLAQSFEPMDVHDKLNYHIKQPLVRWRWSGMRRTPESSRKSIPRRNGTGRVAYARRLASTAACSGIHSALAFGLDSALHEDPRYFRSAGGSFWRRTGHAFRGVILTHTDHGTETFSFWRFGSAYGAAYVFQPVVSGPAQHGGLGIRPGFSATRVRSGSQPGIRVRPGYQTDGVSPKMTGPPPLWFRSKLARIVGDAPAS